jgi:hypothetical protein
MSYQLYFDFRTPEEKAAREEAIKKLNEDLDKIISEEDNLDKILKFIPFGLGRKIPNYYYSFLWWSKCAYQKIRYGVSDSEVFSLYDNISKFILPRLKYFKQKGKKGIPVQFLPNDYHLLSEDDCNAAEDKALKEWDLILDEMIFAFDYIIDSDKHVPFPELLMKDPAYHDFNRKRSPEEQKHWEDYLSLCKKMNERKEKGLHLFVKHFENLWI